MAANDYIKITSDLSKNTKHLYEYLDKANGIDALINYKDRGQIDDEILSKVEGSISVINSRQTGRIFLECGLEAVFVPYLGDFIPGIHETNPVKFQLAFRHEGLFTIDVKRLENVVNDNSPTVTSIVDQIPTQLKEELLDPVAIEEIPTQDKDEVDTSLERPKLAGLKEVGKIELDERSYRPFNKNKKRNP